MPLKQHFLSESIRKDMRNYTREEFLALFATPVWMATMQILRWRKEVIESYILDGIENVKDQTLPHKTDESCRGARVELRFFTEYLREVLIDEYDELIAEDREEREEENVRRKQKPA